MFQILFELWVSSLKGWKRFLEKEKVQNIRIFLCHAVLKTALPLLFTQIDKF